MRQNKFATDNVGEMKNIVRDSIRKDYLEDWRREIGKGNEHLPEHLAETCDNIELLLEDKSRLGDVLASRVTFENLRSIRREIIDH